jgi:hypothetical protein
MSISTILNVLPPVEKNLILVACIALVDWLRLHSDGG